MTLELLEMTLPPSAKFRLLIPFATHALDKVVVQPTQIRESITLWSGNDAIMRELAERVARLADTEGIGLPDLRVEAGKQRLVQICWAAYSRRLHDGIACNPPRSTAHAQSWTELYALTERSIRSARHPRNRQQDTFRVLLAVLHRVFFGDAVAVDDEVSFTIGETGERIRTKIEAGAVSPHADRLAATIRTAADFKVIDKLRYWRIRERESGDAPITLNANEPNGEPQSRFDMTPSDDAESTPEQATVLAMLRAEWLQICREAVAAGKLQIKDLAIFFLVGLHESRSGERDPNDGDGRMTATRNAAETLQRWRTHPGDIAGYLRGQVGFPERDAAMLGGLLAADLAVRTGEIDSTWVSQHLKRGKERLMKQPEVVARLTKLWHDVAETFE
jgi:hypothetical protein